MSNFYVVATPIGNLEDITIRAISTLKSVDVILCEDTRVTKKLLDKYNISNTTISYHSQSKLSKVDKILNLLKEGKNLALVSDAGTPGISDPGSMLLAKIKETLKDSVKIIPIPGASALTSIISVSGLHTHQFTFLGFLPHKKGRETLFKEISESDRAFVFYESPHRILKTLLALEKFCPNKNICLGRELTKIYEEILTGSPSELLHFFDKNQEKVRGEFVLIIAP